MGKKLAYLNQLVLINLDGCKFIIYRGSHTLLNWMSPLLSSRTSCLMCPVLFLYLTAVSAKNVKPLHTTW